MVLKPELLTLVLAALASVGLVGALEGRLWPLPAALLSLVPLQLAALVWVWGQRPRGGGRPAPGWRPPASAGSAPATGSGDG